MERGHDPSGMSASDHGNDLDFDHGHVHDHIHGSDRGLLVFAARTSPDARDPVGHPVPAAPHACALVQPFVARRFVFSALALPRPSVAQSRASCAILRL